MNKQIAINVLNKVLEYLNQNPNEFAKSLGMNRSQAIYDVLNPDKKVGISKKFSEKIIEKYPNFNQLWLLTGDGEMLKPDNEVNIVSEPSVKYQVKEIHEPSEDRIIINYLKEENQRLAKEVARLELMLEEHGINHKRNIS